MRARRSGPVILILAVLAAGCGEPTIGGRPASEWNGSEPGAAAALARSLAEGGRQERIAAARVAARISPTDFDSHLARALADAADDDDPWVRRWAVAALSRRCFDATVAVPALLRRLEDERTAIREAAVASLGRRGPDAAPAASALAGILGTEDGPLATLASWALGEIGKGAREAAAPVLDRMDGHARRRMDLSLPTFPGKREQRYSYEEMSVVVRADHRGKVQIEKKRLTLDQLRAYLRMKADSSRTPTADRSSKVIGLLALDEDLPWDVAEALLGVLAHDPVRIVNVEIAVRRQEDLRLGRVGFSIRRPNSGFDAVISVGAGGPLHAVDRLRDPLTAMAARRPGSVVGIRADGWVRVRDVVAAVVEVERAGLTARPLSVRPAPIDAPEAAGERERHVVTWRLEEKSR